MIRVDAHRAGGRTPLTESNDAPRKKPSALRDVSGTTVALTSLAVMGAAAVVSAPLWFWLRRKRKRTDALVSQPHPDLAASHPATADEPAVDGGPPSTPGGEPGPAGDR